jgi:hypothetical protein
MIIYDNLWYSVPLVRRLARENENTHLSFSRGAVGDGVSYDDVASHLPPGSRVHAVQPVVHQQSSAD